ncbi:hypothetical protein PV327_010445 [Microctonus hyperodae]|uniref:Uncharacterized protein n=1 Tax=Microctonus hyperodae TaxID=165561 RepID=A0AA39FS66_MICHY|nr:hypothetical protein PV327_010445 [Microctonus hyperodae]
MDSSSESKSKKKVTFSTPTHDAVEMNCTLSSISAGSSDSSTKKKYSLLSKITIHHNDNKIESVPKGIVGDAIREGFSVSDIRPDKLEQLFSNLKTTESSVCKLFDECIQPSISSRSEQSSSSTEDTLLTVGEHYFTYGRKPPRKVADSPIKNIDLYSYRRADLLWEDFIKDDPPRITQKKKKKVNCFLIESKYKFFKSKGKRLQDEKNLNKFVVRKKRKVDNESNCFGMSTPSLTRPLGLMASLGIGLAERLEACNETSKSSQPYEFLSSSRRNNIYEEYSSSASSEDVQDESKEYPSPILIEDVQDESEEYPSPILSEDVQDESEEYPSSISNSDEQREYEEYSSSTCNINNKKNL